MKTQRWYQCLLILIPLVIALGLLLFSIFTEWWSINILLFFYLMNECFEIVCILCVNCVLKRLFNRSKKKKLELHLM